ncbi:MAG: hypothetical protein ACHQK9_07250 [Reyranellales bacterium]
MSVSSITSSAAAAYVQKITSGTGQTGASSAMQEATETAAVTAKEAAHGDPQARAKLARQQQQQALQSPPAKESGKGEFVDHAA